MNGIRGLHGVAVVRGLSVKLTRLQTLLV